MSCIKVHWRSAIKREATYETGVVYSFKGNDTIQIHFNYSYKLWIFFHTVSFAYHKMKYAKKLGASIQLRKKEIFEGGWGILEF